MEELTKLLLLKDRREKKIPNQDWQNYNRA
jgi:hypothetical protein